MNQNFSHNQVLAEDYAAVMRPENGAGLLDRSWRSVLQLRGRDRQNFLQGMVSNDIATLTPGQGCRAALLDTTAHLLADLYVHCLPDTLLIETDPVCAERVAQTLDKYLIMEKVTIADVSSEWTILSLMGDCAKVLLEALVPESIPDRFPLLTNQTITLPDGASGLLVVFLHGQTPGYDLWLPTLSKAVVWESLLDAGAVPISQETAEVLRVEAGIAAWGHELTEAILLPEAGLADAVSYTKGCYVGQEIVARLHARGHTNRSLRSVLLPENAPVPQFGNMLYAPAGSDETGREIGRITSAVRSPRFDGRPLALAYVRKEYTADGTSLEVLVTTSEGQIVTEGIVQALPQSRN